MGAAVIFTPGRDRVEVDLTQRQVACPAHFAPFRDRWPLGWPDWSMRVSQAALDSPALQAGLSDPAFWRSMRMYWEGLHATLGPDRVRALLDDRPACEWVEPRALFAAYLACDVGVVATCTVCGRHAQGTPYPVRSGASYDVVPHVCFRCVVNRRLA